LGGRGGLRRRRHGRRVPGIQRDASDDLVSDDPRQALERRVLGRDRRIFGADDVDACVGACGCVQQHRIVADPYELIARAQRAAFARDAVIGADAQASDLVVEANIDPVDCGRTVRR
jgi:hypothetical protein